MCFLAFDCFGWVQLISIGWQHEIESYFSLGKQSYVIKPDKNIVYIMNDYNLEKHLIFNYSESYLL